MFYISTVFYNFIYQAMKQHSISLLRDPSQKTMNKHANKHQMWIYLLSKRRVTKFEVRVCRLPAVWNSSDQFCISKREQIHATSTSAIVYLTQFSCHLSIFTQRVWWSPGVLALKLLNCRGESLPSFSKTVWSLRRLMAQDYHCVAIWPDKKWRREGGKKRKKKTERTKANTGGSRGLSYPKWDGSRRRAGGWGGNGCLEVWLREAFSNRVSGGRGMG